MANVMRWDPFRELEGIQARLNRMFGGYPEGEMGFAEWMPEADVHETDKEYLVKMDLPEVKREEVKVEFENGVLAIEGERKMEKDEKGAKYHKVERGYGKFVRRFALPTEIDAEKVNAEFKDGVLNVHLPKSPAIKKSIEVKVA